MSLGRGLSALIPSRKLTPHLVTPHPSPLSQGGRESVWHVPVTSVRPNPHQPRRNFSHEALEDLINSIKEHGVIQPIVVSEAVDGQYELVSGERRLRAATMAGLATIPAVVRQVAKERNKLELALIENIQRQDLNPIEEAFAFQRLTDEFGLTQEEVAKQVGKSRPYISNTVRLLSLPEEIQTALINQEFSASAAKVLLGLKDSAAQLKMFKQLMSAGGTVEEAENLISSALTRKQVVKRDPLLLDQESQLRGVLGTKVKITKRGSQGVIAIYYYSPEELAKLVKQINRP